MVRKFLQSLFSSDSREEADRAADRMAKELVRRGKGKTHGVKVVKRKGTYQVDLYGEDDK
ncbi:MAG TPA: hypothetical protein VIY48_19085 [Candidatus Paceibacterota bacterium]